MSENIWVNILMFSLPSGFVVQLLNWYRSRRIASAQKEGNIDAAYINNINMLRSEIIKIQDENRRLYKAVAKLDKTIARATACRYFDNCPIKHELQKQPTVDNLEGDRRYNKHYQKIRADTATCSDGDGGLFPSGDEGRPPSAPPWDTDSGE